MTTKPKRLTRAELDAEVKARAGCIQLRYTRQTGTLVGVYASAEAGMEDYSTLPWTTVCEEHNTLACHTTKKLALYHASDPRGWCEECRGKEDPS